MPLSPGTKLGQYEVVESIGAGGMGEVYRARDTKLGRDVAIKVLPDEFSEDKERLDRFEREARLLAQLNHANIATLHGLEEHDGQQFLIMELVEGETLAERIARGPLSVDEAVPLFILIAEGLEAAHEKGIIHRDLKPANIKIGPDGKPKILDFGLAKAFIGQETASDSSQSPTLTKGTAFGVILGTASYMSPEQARGQEVDDRTDVFSFGSVLFELLTGERAFRGDTVTDVLAAVVHTEPDWSLLPSGVPQRLRDLVARCVRKDLRKRIQHIGDVRIALEEVQAPLEASAGAAPVATGGRTIGSIVVAAALAATLAWWLKPAPAASELVTRSIIPLEPGTTLPRTQVTTRNLALSPDGETLAYVAVSHGVRQLYLRPLDALSATVMPETEGAQMPFFSDDGEWVGFLDAGGLRKAPLGGGPSVRLFSANITDFRGASWGDAGIIALTTASAAGLSLLDADGGDLQSLTALDREEREKSHRFPELLPGSEHVLFTVGTGDIDAWHESSIAIVSRDTGQREILAVGGSAPIYSPTGHLIYAGDGELLAVPFNLGSLRVDGTPVAVLEDLATDPHYGHAQFALSGSGGGTLVYARGGPWRRIRRLVAVSPDGRVDTLVDEEGPFRHLSVSPDERSLVLEREGANASVWIYDRNRRTMSRRTFAFDSYNPEWSPDGKWVSFYSTRRGSIDLYRQHADRSDEVELLVRDVSGSNPGHSWSSDGAMLAYETRGSDSIDIAIVSLDEDRSDVAVLNEGANEKEPAFSPDVRLLAYSSDESGQFEVFLRSFPDLGLKFQVSTNGGTRPRWGSEGRRLFYRNGDSVMVVQVAFGSEESLGVPQLHLELPFSDTTDFDTLADGRVVTNPYVDTSGPPRELVLIQNFFAQLERLVPTN